MSAADVVRRVAYGAAEVATRRRGLQRTIDGETLRIAPRWARYYPATYDPAKRRFLRASCAPGATVLDIGAHLGLYTVVMARAVGPTGRVVAFEPTPATVDELRRTVALNDVGDRVEIRSMAVGAVPGRLPFHDTGDALSNANSLVRIDRATTSFDVEVTTVDAVADGRPIGCVKVDVEGGEVDVLRGATSTMSTSRPAIALEVHPATIGEAGVRAIAAIVDEHDYELAIAGVAVTVDDLVARPAGFEAELLPRRR
jgi:FkbM family methyltransferase